MQTLVYDIEVIHGPDQVPKGWANPEAMGLASCVVYCYDTDRYEFYLHDKMKPALNHRLNNNLCIGFNSIQFDSRVLLGNERQWVVPDQDTTINLDEFVGWKNYDVMVEYVRKRFEVSTQSETIAFLNDPTNHGDGIFSLDGLAQGTLGLRKSGKGALAPELYRAEKYDDLLAYNLNDVRLTKALYERVMKNQPLIGRDGVPVFIERKPRWLANEQV